MTRARRLARWLAAGVLLACASPAAGQSAAQGKAPSAPQSPPVNACIECHTLFDAPLKVTAEQMAADIHTQKGLDCAACHGGDTSTLDMEQAKSRAARFRGKIPRAQIPRMCAECHSDAAYMRGFDPSVRTDQLAQYLTSVHGQRLARGDTRVAVCTDCHSVHGIRPATDTRSTVHPLNVAATCARCHSDEALMKPYGVSTAQFAEYQESVHHKALALRGDLSAPTCSTCHGTHGAAPPGVQSVEHVCATCHVFQAQLFDTSPHKSAFATMGLAPCITCHSNHRIEPTSDHMLGAGEQSVCTTCHAQGDAGYDAAVKMFAMLQGLEAAIASARQVVDRAERSGMEVSQARLDLAAARDVLTKTRVTIHAFRLDPVAEEIEEGRGIAAKALAGGQQALTERDFRRLGLAISVVFILAVILSLRMYLRHIEAEPSTQ